MATSGTTCTEAQKSRLYYFKLHMLITDGGRLVLRSILEQKLTDLGITMFELLKNNKAKIKKMRTKGILSQVQYDLLFPPGGSEPSTSDMDITIIICLLRNLKCFGLRNIDWSKEPAPTDFTLEADICRLIHHRNYMCHISTTADIREQEFVTMWNDNEQLLIRLSCPSLNIWHTIAEIKRFSLTEVENDKFRKLTEENENNDLKKDLIALYRKKHSKVQLSPLFTEKDTPLATFYIRPEIHGKKPRTDEIHQIESLSNLFRTGKENNREVYLTADSGMGKTTFSKYLALLWCQVHHLDKEAENFYVKDDIDCMRQFDYVFIVLLRESNNLCSVDDFIFELIISTLAHSKQFDKYFLQDILNNETCLVILDGLDEWVHPENGCYKNQQIIPHRNAREKCTVLTTTRPWKLGILNLTSNELGNEFTLTKLCPDSAVRLAKRALQRLRSLPDGQFMDEIDRFFNDINATNHGDLVSVPLLLMYMICLWCDGEEIGNSKCELFVKIIEMLLSRMTVKHGEFKSLYGPSGLDNLSCFTRHCHCTKYHRLLLKLGELGFCTLFNEKRQNTLVFDRTITERYLNKQEMLVSLHSGILTESITKTLTNKNSKVSFSHKIVHEFFAAVYVSSKSDGLTIFLEKCKTVQRTLDLSSLCQFISGINATLMYEISAGLMSVINKDKKTQEYRTRTGRENITMNHLYHTQNMLLSCLKEIPDSENVQLCIQDLFISDDREDLQRLSKFNKNNIKSLYIDNRSTSRSLCGIIGLYGLDDLNYVRKLYYEGDEKTEAEMDRLLSPCLQSLTLLRGRWIKYEKDLCERLINIQNIHNLHVDMFTFSHASMEEILDFVSSKTSLQNVKLSGLYCNEHKSFNCEMRNIDMSKHSKLSRLDLSWLPPLQLDISTPSLTKVELSCFHLNERSLLLSPDMLNITKLTLAFMQTSAESLKSNVKNLGEIPHSVAVEINGCYFKEENEHERFRSFIQSSCDFEVTFDSVLHGQWIFSFHTKKPNAQPCEIPQTHEILYTRL